MEKDNLEDLYNLSPMQEGMLFHSLYSPESDVYFRQLSYAIEGSLDVSAFEKAWQGLLSRHSILRTSFFWQDLDRPLQAVNRNVILPLEKLDWRDMPDESRTEQLRQFLESEQRRGFDLSNPPLMRIALIEFSNDYYYFVWSYHHLILDGWSRSVLMKEFRALYQSFQNGKDVELERPLQYRDYISWLQKQDLEQAELAWRKLLQDVTSATVLGEDRFRSTRFSNSQSTSSQSGKYQIKLSAEETAALQNLARRQHLTVNTFVQGAWAILLSRYSGDRNVIFGITVSGRSPELEGADSIVGVFINTLPLCVHVDPNQNTIPWLQELQARQLEMRQYEYTPLVEVQKWSKIPRGQSPFESIIVFENYQAGATSEQPARNANRISDVCFVEDSNYALTLTATPARELSLVISYHRSHFDDEKIVGMAGHLRELLASMIDSPESRLANLSMLSKEEEERLVTDWKMTDSNSVVNQHIHTLIEDRVKQNPDAIAVVFQNEQLTYEEINRRANQLARYLRSRGVVAEQSVGVCLERSSEMICALLGILKAGGVYVPLDPGYPDERFSFVLSDAGINVLLTRQRLITGLPETAALCDFVCLDSDWDDIALCDADDLVTGTDPDNLAYVIYTSGSSGKPKGVCVSHSSAARHFEVMEKAFGLRSDDHFLQFASATFDVSIEQIISPLLSGATVVLRGPEIWTAADFAKAIHWFGLTVINPPTAYWHQLAKEIAENKTTLGRQLRLAIVGGEAISPEYVRFWMEATSNQIGLINAYGPTEGVITSTALEIQSYSEALSRRVPIGRPLDGRAAYNLDADGNLTPSGLSGELHLGGALLSRCYLKRADLTAEKFIPDRFSGETGARLYKTGDIVRYLPDANIEYLGRSDNQVKLRGFRIELSEIESSIAQHPMVRECVVVIREDDPERKHLTSYVVPQNGDELTGGELRSFLKSKLPEYMIPSEYVLLDHLPLTGNGKIDRQALFSAVPRGLESGEIFVAPRTPVEIEVAQMWSEILGVEKVGITDNFFDLGGHSLNITQLASRIRKNFDLELSLRDLFDNPTLQEMTATIAARHIDQSGESDVAQMLAELKQLSSSEVQTLLKSAQQKA